MKFKLKGEVGNCSKVISAEQNTQNTVNRRYNFNYINQAQMENIDQRSFYDFLNLVSYNQSYKFAIAEAQALYNIKSANIDKLTPSKIDQFYRKIVVKGYSNKSLKLNSWLQNQLRVFIWLLINYLYLHKKTIQSLNDQDWQFFSQILNDKNILHFQFQSLSLLKLKKTHLKWEIEQVQLLQKIINSKTQKNKWNLIARDLFIISNKKYFKSPKQCRQRWLNYLDPQKKKQSWSLHEDLVLFQTVLNCGKKWSLIVKYLKNGRTQHNVKNRYKAIISNQLKLINSISPFDERLILTQIINKFKIDLQQNFSELKRYQELVQFQKCYRSNQLQRKVHMSKINNKQKQVQVQKQEEHQFLIMSEQSLEFEINYHLGDQVNQNNNNVNNYHILKQKQQQYIAQTIQSNFDVQASQHYSEFEQQIRQFLG